MRKTRWRAGAGREPRWLAALAIAGLVLIVLPVSIWMFGMLGPVIGLLALIVLVLAAILARLGKR